LADEVVTHIAPVIPMEGCSARLLEHVEAAVEAGALAATPSPSS
jgi:hypothetical protein